MPHMERHGNAISQVIHGYKYRSHFSKNDNCQSIVYYRYCALLYIGSLDDGVLHININGKKERKHFTHENKKS